MEKSTKTDWGRLSPCDLTKTLAYENAKKMFPSKDEDLWKDVAALALIESTFPEGYECNIIDLVDAIRNTYKIDRPLCSSLMLIYHPFLVSNKETHAISTQGWLKEVAEKQIENHIFENQEAVYQAVEPRIRNFYKETYSKDIIIWPDMDNNCFKNACMANAQNKIFVVDWRCTKSRSYFIRFSSFQEFAREFGLDVGFISNYAPSSQFDDYDFKYFVEEGEQLS